MRIHTEKQEFGFLPARIESEFNGARVSLLPHFEKALDWINEASNRDGYYYPPMFATFDVDLTTGERGEKVPRTSRPAAVYHLPTSHRIDITNPVEKDDPSVSDEALIVHALAFLFGTRLQFKEWRFEGRVPIKPANNWSLSEKVATHFLNHLYSKWRSFSAQVRTRIINVVYLHTRARSIEWQWESFTQNYMVLDAIFSIYAELHGAPQRLRHTDRVRYLCECFEISYEQDLLNLLCNTRNELFHEALWTGNRIGSTAAAGPASHIHFQLARLNERLICGIVGYRNEFSRSAWWHMGTFYFDEYAP